MNKKNLTPQNLINKCFSSKFLEGYPIKVGGYTGQNIVMIKNKDKGV